MKLALTLTKFSDFSKYEQNLFHHCKAIIESRKLLDTNVDPLLKYMNKCFVFSSDDLPLENRSHAFKSILSNEPFIFQPYFKTFSKKFQSFIHRFTEKNEKINNALDEINHIDKPKQFVDPILLVFKYQKTNEIKYIKGWKKSLSMKSFWSSISPFIWKRNFFFTSSMFSFHLKRTIDLNSFLISLEKNDSFSSQNLSQAFIETLKSIETSTNTSFHFSFFSLNKKIIGYSKYATQKVSKFLKIGNKDVNPVIQYSCQIIKTSGSTSATFYIYHDFIKIQFQDFEKIIYIPGTKIIHILLRNRVQKPTAFEIFRSNGSSILLDFAPKMAKDIISLIKKNISLPKLRVCQDSFQQYIEQTKIFSHWAKGNINNFMFLLHLNLLSGRSFHDPENYPFFPWISFDELFHSSKSISSSFSNSQKYSYSSFTDESSEKTNEQKEESSETINEQIKEDTELNNNSNNNSNNNFNNSSNNSSNNSKERFKDLKPNHSLLDSLDISKFTKKRQQSNPFLSYGPLNQKKKVHSKVRKSFTMTTLKRNEIGISHDEVNFRNLSLPVAMQTPSKQNHLFL